jgi:hypothetical protein
MPLRLITKYNQAGIRRLLRSGGRMQFCVHPLGRTTGSCWPFREKNRALIRLCVARVRYDEAVPIVGR